MPAQKYILAGPTGGEEGDDDDLNAPGGAEADDQPVIVAEMTAEIPSLTVSEAVMRLDLADLTAMMFRNSAHGGLNMVYRRPDGNIGWLDPQGNATS